MSVNVLDVNSTKPFSSFLAKLWLINAWLVTAAILLIIPMDEHGQLRLLNTPEQSLLRIVFFGALLLSVIILTYVGGKFIDHNPRLINVEVILGFIATLAGLLAYTQVNSFLSLLMGLFLIGAGSSLLSTSAFTLLGILADTKKRGQTVGQTMLGALFLLLILIALRWLFSQAPQFENLGYVGSFKEVVVIHGTIVLVFISFLVSLLILTMKGKIEWKNDQWPTPDARIITRNSVQLYFLSHFLIYVILGISVGVIARYGTDLGLVNTVLQIQSPVRDTFWFFTVLGDLVFVMPLGKIADRKGRKTVALASIYVLATAVLGLSSIPVDYLIHNQWPFYLTAFLIGTSFAGIHVTLDSSTWYDLAPQDSMGRYVACGLISLIIGLGLGRLVGLNIEFSSTFDFNLLGYLMLFVIVLVLLPLNLVDDSYPPLQFIILLVRLKGGLLIYSHDFGNDQIDKTRLDLISGALEAIDTFMQEVLEEGYLRMVQHSTFYILNDGYKEIRVNLICNKSKKEIKDTLHQFTVAFYEKYQNVITKWTGNVLAFRDANQIVESIFGPLMVDTT